MDFRLCACLIGRYLVSRHAVLAAIATDPDTNVRVSGNGHADLILQAVELSLLSARPK
jgi:hypothetical protein